MHKSMHSVLKKFGKDERQVKGIRSHLSRDEVMRKKSEGWKQDARGESLAFTSARCTVILTLGTIVIFSTLIKYLNQDMMGNIKWSTDSHWWTELHCR